MFMVVDGQNLLSMILKKCNLDMQFKSSHFYIASFIFTFQYRSQPANLFQKNKNKIGNAKQTQLIFQLQNIPCALFCWDLKINANARTSKLIKFLLCRNHFYTQNSNILKWIISSIVLKKWFRIVGITQIKSLLKTWEIMIFFDFCETSFQILTWP